MSAPRSPAAERFDPPLAGCRFVTSEETGVDELLAEAERLLAGSGTSAARALEHGGVFVNGAPLDAAALPARVPAGAWIVVYAFVREPEPPPGAPFRVLHDGDGVVAVDKPAWWPMQRTRATARLTLEAALRAQLGDTSLVAAHRLDRQTSGVAVFARGPAGAWASRAFALRRAEKRYLAVVAPPPQEGEFSVTGWMARAPDPARFRFALQAEPAPGARESATHFRVLASGAGRALVEARPETGRTHQLRVHLASRGSPVVGDDLYGPPYEPAAASAAERTLLHAAELALERADGTVLRIAAEAPLDLSRALTGEGAPALPREAPRRRARGS